MRILALWLLCIGLAWGQPFPSKPIEVVNSFAPGGALDLNVRALQAGAEKALGTVLVQTFRQGGGGIVGTTEVAGSTPDGHKLLIVTSGELTAGPNLAKTSYSIDSFAFIGRISSRPYGFVVKSDAPFREFEDFRRSAAANPGKHTIGMSLLPVPYGGSGPYLTAVLGGHVDAPKGTAAERLAFLGNGFRAITNDPAFIETAAKLGVEPAWAEAAEFEKQVRDEDQVFRALVKELGLGPK